METKFNVFEILQIAEKIDHNGAKFFLKTAELFDDPELRNIFYTLANWRARHEKILAQRRKRFSETRERPLYRPGRLRPASL